MGLEIQRFWVWFSARAHDFPASRNLCKMMFSGWSHAWFSIQPVNLWSLLLYYQKGLSRLTRATLDIEHWHWTLSNSCHLHLVLYSCQSHQPSFNTMSEWKWKIYFIATLIVCVCVCEHTYFYRKQQNESAEEEQELSPVFIKTLNYTSRFSKYKNRETISAVRRFVRVLSKGFGSLLLTVFLAHSSVLMKS